jgi:hypothetical protein
MLTSVAIVGLVVVSLAAPATAKTVSANTWAKKFCTTLSKWQTAISDGSKQIQTTLGGITDLTQAKTQLTSFLDQMVSATDDAQSSLKSAGAPDTTNGDKIASTFVKGLGATKSIFATASTNAKSLSTTDPSAFQTQAQSIASALNSSSDELSKSFSGIDKLDKGAKLSAVLVKTKACASIVGGS